MGFHFGKIHVIGNFAILAIFLSTQFSGLHYIHDGVQPSPLSFHNFSSPQMGALSPLTVTPHSSLPRPRVTSALCVFGLSVLDTAYKWNHRLRGLGGFFH